MRNEGERGGILQCIAHGVQGALDARNIIFY